MSKVVQVKWRLDVITSCSQKSTSRRWQIISGTSQHTLIRLVMNILKLMKTLITCIFRETGKVSLRYKDNWHKVTTRLGSSNCVLVTDELGTYMDYEFSIQYEKCSNTQELWPPAQFMWAVYCKRTRPQNGVQLNWGGGIGTRQILGSISLKTCVRVIVQFD